ncbi:MAG: D-ribose ABC transporter substrate-binding protein, partial [Lachnospiraceae bacterium]|nr:D-ribose ABC transporter substrate-binding protein [Lachnospiraceae bacterium]
MKNIKRFLALALVLVMMLSLTACRITIDGENNSQKKKVTNGSIGLSISTQNNPFFVSLADGAKKAAKELGVELTVVDAGDDVTKQ